MGTAAIAAELGLEVEAVPTLVGLAEAKQRAAGLAALDRGDRPGSGGPD
jgi:hypothetical protein